MYEILICLNIYEIDHNCPLSNGLHVWYVRVH